jgi:stage III sporulation protein AH
MMVFKRKQIVILALVLVIVIAGYLQYSYRQGSTATDVEGRLGEAVYVDNEIYNEGIEGSELSLAEDTDGQNNITASKIANDFFVQARMDREQVRSKSNESLKAITEDINASEEIKAEAHQKMIMLTENSEKEMRIETLINKMGFEDTFILFADDGTVDIVVKTPSLSASQTAQITDIVIRQGNADVEDICIKPLF